MVQPAMQFSSRTHAGRGRSRDDGWNAGFYRSVGLLFLCEKPANASLDKAFARF